jgi:hypothetical protein
MPETQTATEKLILAADKLKPGDYVHEFAATVKEVRESERYSGIRETVFDGQPGVFFLFFADYYHVERPVSADDEDHQGDDAPDEEDEDQDDEPARWEDDTNRW